MMILIFSDPLVSTYVPWKCQCEHRPARESAASLAIKRVAVLYTFGRTRRGIGRVESFYDTANIFVCLFYS